MPISLTFLCATAAHGMSRPIFDDVAMSGAGLYGADVLGAALSGYSVAVRGPSAGCARTAQALAVTAEVEPALRDFDYGEWHGRTVAEIAATDPYGLSALLTDPDAVPHGGESVRQFCRRVKDWLGSLPPRTGRAVAITEPAVTRAALIHALSDPVSAFWHIRVAPSAVVTLRSQDGCWSVRLGPVPRVEPGRMPQKHLIGV